MNIQLALRHIAMNNPDVDFTKELFTEFVHSMASVDLKIREINPLQMVNNILPKHSYNILWLGFLIGKGYSFTPVCDNCMQTMWCYGAFDTPLLSKYFICSPVCSTQFTLNPANLMAVRQELLDYDADSCMTLLTKAIVTLDPTNNTPLTQVERYRKSMAVYESIFNNPKKEAN